MPTPVQYDNVRLQSAGVLIDPPNTGVWIRCAVQHESTEMISTAGARVYRAQGVLVSTVKAPLSDGDEDVRAIAKTIVAAFEGQLVDGITYGSAIVTPSARSGRWYQMIVSVPFQSDFKERPSLGTESGVVLDPVEVGNSIRSWFGTQIEDVLPLPTQYDDAPFVQPDAGRWCRFTIIESGSVPVGKDGPAIVQRKTGLAMAQIFIPIRIGDGLALATADSIATSFRAVSVDGISFRAPDVITVGEGRDGKWWQVNVSCPFSYETLST